MMDLVGNKVAGQQIALIKVCEALCDTLHDHSFGWLVHGLMMFGICVCEQVVAPNMCQRVLDRAIQVHGAAGVSEDFPLAYYFGANRYGIRKWSDDGGRHVTS